MLPKLPICALPAPSILAAIACNCTESKYKESEICVESITCGQNVVSHLVYLQESPPTSLGSLVEYFGNFRFQSEYSRYVWIKYLSQRNSFLLSQIPIISQAILAHHLLRALKCQFRLPLHTLGPFCSNHASVQCNFSLKSAWYR